jgi:phospholipid-binding lipoprotein MlaA
MNRVFFKIEDVLDRLVLRPAAIGYKRIIPRPIRQGLANVVSNLGEPAVMANDVLQGHGKKASHTFVRFAGNTTFGLFGLIDVATPSGLPHHNNDLGLTLARYGVKSGPYLFLPLIGPTTARDLTGSLGSLAFNPLIYTRYPGDAEVGVITGLTAGLNARANADGQLKALNATATDPYASLRSFYLQSRQSEVMGGVLDIKALPDFDDSAATPSPPPPATPSASPAPNE